MNNCIFCQLQDGRIPSNKIYEDDFCFVIHDIKPQAPVHLLVITKKHMDSLMETELIDQELLGHLLLAAKDVARQHGLFEGGFRLVVNTGEGAGQTIKHLHIHVLGGAILDEQMA